CRRSWPSASSCHWCPAAPRAPAWDWRWRSRWRASTAARWATARAPATPCSRCCCRCPRQRRTGTSRRTRMSDAPLVWIVDDGRSVRFVLARALAAAGLAVREFAAAEPALAALADGAPQLVFTDIRMPGLGGLAFLQQLAGSAASVPVVVMSAWTDLPSTAGAFQGGAHEFLSKPFDLDAAVALAERLLERESA